MSIKALSDRSAKYLSTHSVNVLMKEIIEECLKSKPDDLYQYILNFCKQKKEILDREKMRKDEKLKFQGSPDDVIPDFPRRKSKNDEVIQAKLQRMAENKGRTRQGISAEASGAYNNKTNFQPRVIKKLNHEILQIKSVLLKNFCFNCLHEKELNIVLEAMEIQSYEPNEYVIRQGDVGAEMFIVGSGTLKCTKKFSPDGEEIFLKNYATGEVFGELALMYNVPRAANVITETKVSLYSLDRETFNQIVKTAAVKRREQHENLIKKIAFMKGMSEEEIGRICDCLQPEKFTKGQTIIQEGETGDKVYFLTQGEVEVYKKQPDGSEKKVASLMEGVFFGEIALLKSGKREATVKAFTNEVICATLDKDSFKRLFGKFEKQLKDQAKKYNQ